MIEYITQGKAEVIDDRGTLRIEARYIDELRDRLGDEIVVELRHRNGYVEITRSVWKSEASFSVLEDTLEKIDASEGDTIHYKVKESDETGQQELDEVADTPSIQAVRSDSDDEDYHLIAGGKSTTACGKSVKNTQERYQVPKSDMLTVCEHCGLLQDKTMTVKELKAGIAENLSISELSDGQHFSKIDAIKIYVAVAGGSP